MRGLKKIIIVSLVLFMVMMVLPACSNEESQGGEQVDKDEKQEQLEKVVISLDWTPNTNHTGLYVVRIRDFLKRLDWRLKLFNHQEALLNN